MDIDEIKELLKAVTESDVSEFEIEEGDRKIRIKRGTDSGAAQPPYVVLAGGLPTGFPPQPSQAPQVSGPRPEESASSAQEPPEDDDVVLVASPMVGTFYESPSPGSPAFVDVGDRVEAGQTLCIIEAMKLMNEIEAETSGVVTKRFVANSQPVEYGESLFAIRPE